MVVQMLKSFGSMHEWRRKRGVCSALDRREDSDMKLRTWTIAELRQRYIIWDEEYSIELRSSYPDSAVVTVDDVLRGSVFPPRVRFAFAVEMTGLGGKKLKSFAVDCAVCLLSLLKEDTPGYGDLDECIPLLRSYITRPTIPRVKELRKLTWKFMYASYPRYGTTFRERGVRSICGNILGVTGRAISGIQTEGPQRYDPFAPRQAARYAGYSTVRSIAEHFSRSRASSAAAQACWRDIEFPTSRPRYTRCSPLGLQSIALSSLTSIEAHVFPTGPRLSPMILHATSSNGMTTDWSNS